MEDLSRDTRPLYERIEEINQKLGQLEKEKEFKLPFFKRLGLGSTKKGKALVQTIMTNGSVKFDILKIDENTVKRGDIYHDASSNYIMRYGKYPLIILKEWGMRPISPGQEFERDLTNGELTSAEKVIISKIQADLVKPKMNINIGMILLIGALLIGGYYILNNMGVLNF